jgi:outer membrane protein OmpA-like peptidoglycan-associated protein
MKWTLAVAFLFSASILFSQEDKKSLLCITYTINDIVAGQHLSAGNLKKALQANPAQFNNGVSLDFIKSLSKKIDVKAGLGISFSQSPLNLNTASSKKWLSIFNVATNIHLKNNNNPFSPFLSTGFQFIQYRGSIHIGMPIGIGMQSRIAKDVYLLIATGYILPVSDKLQSSLSHSLGIAGSLLSKKQKRKLTSKRPVAHTSIATLSQDSDLDGLPDLEDECPFNYGLPRYNGCPDLDGDSIPDKTDACPTTFGLAENNGCPAIVPVNKLLSINKVKDSFDTIATTSTLEDKFSVLASYILFETNSAALEPQSYQYLDSVATLISSYPSLQLYVYGHTDNIGSKFRNLKLSESRALAIKRYLTNKFGINNRITILGLGFSKPKAPNNTSAGRELNRRVEISSKKLYD